MKVKQDTTLFTVLTGSRLYGTHNESSDYDYKAVALPALADLLLNKKFSNRKERPEGLKDGDKMLAGEAETEYLPLQTFMQDFYEGQTYALEVAFAVTQGLHRHPLGVADDPEAWRKHYAAVEVMHSLVERFLTNNVKKMVGYAVTQARMYGLKTRRYTAVKEFTDHLRVSFSNVESMQQHRVGDTPQLLAEVLSMEYVVQTEIENARGGSEMAPALDVAGKKFPFTNTWYSVYKSMMGTLDAYGARVKQFDGEGTDWKALSHALRVTEQVLELSEFGTLTFPRPNAEYLKAVKEGRLELESVTDVLNAQFERVDEVVARSVLKERTPALDAEFEEFKMRVVLDLYGLK